MASEGLVTVRLKAVKGNLSFDRSQSKSFDIATARYTQGVQAIGTSYEAIVIPAEISTGGWSTFRNLDATNYVEIGVVVSSTFYSLVKLKANDPPAVFRLGQVSNLYARANTGACDLEFTVIAD